MDENVSKPVSKAATSAKVFHNSETPFAEIVIEADTSGLDPDAKLFFSAIHRDGKLTLRASSKMQPEAAFTYGPEGELLRVAVETGLQKDAIGDDAIFAASVMDGELVFTAVPQSKSLDSGKVNLRTTVVTTESGITSLSLPVGVLPQKQDSPIYFRMEVKNNRIRMRAVEVPSYYLAGITKKMDIRGEWNDPFRKAADQVRNDGATMLDYDRLYTVWQCVSNVSRMSAAIVEIGVLRGGTSALIAHAMNHFNKDGALYSCDTFVGHEEVDERYDMRHKPGTFGDRTSEQLVRDYLKPFPNAVVLAGDIKQTAGLIAEPDLAMIHLDVDVYPTTKFVLDQMARRLVHGGILLVDDYGVTSCPGVKRAVDDFAKTAKGFSFLHLLTGQALLIRTD